MLAPDEVILFGVATDVCNHAAIVGLLDRGYRVAFVEDAARGPLRRAGAGVARRVARAAACASRRPTRSSRRPRDTSAARRARREAAVRAWASTGAAATRTGCCSTCSQVGAASNVSRRSAPAPASARRGSRPPSHPARRSSPRSSSPRWRGRRGRLRRRPRRPRLPGDWRQTLPPHAPSICSSSTAAARRTTRTPCSGRRAWGDHRHGRLLRELDGPRTRGASAGSRTRAWLRRCSEREATRSRSLPSSGASLRRRDAAESHAAGRPRLTKTARTHQPTTASGATAARSEDDPAATRHATGTAAAAARTGQRDIPPTPEQNGRQDRRPSDPETDEARRRITWLR